MSKAGAEIHAVPAACVCMQHLRCLRRVCVPWEKFSAPVCGNCLTNSNIKTSQKINEIWLIFNYLTFNYIPQTGAEIFCGLCCFACFFCVACCAVLLRMLFLRCLLCCAASHTFLRCLLCCATSHAFSALLAVLCCFTCFFCVACCAVLLVRQHLYLLRPIGIM